MPDTPQTWPGRRPRGQSRRQRYSVLFNGREILLKQGSFLVGRSPSCHLVLEDMLASRQHAKLLVSAVSLVVEDLTSTNGVYVNDRLVDAPTALAHGDRVLIGRTELSVFAQRMPDTDRSDSADLEAELDAIAGVDEASGRMPTTVRRDAFSAVGNVAERMLADGRTDAAVHMLSGHLREVLAAARSGTPIAPELRASATHYALLLGAAGKDPTWANLAVELNLIERHPLPHAEIEKLMALARVPGLVDLELFRYYQEMLRSRLHRMSPGELERCRRLLEIDPA